MSLEDKLRDLFKHYYLYMKQCEIAGDGKISHTTVKTAMADANEFNDKIIAQIKQAFQDDPLIKLALAYREAGGDVDNAIMMSRTNAVRNGLMTGQEWYDRFKKDFWAAINETLPEDHKITIHDITYLDDFGADDILDIAKRAAGLDT